MLDHLQRQNMPKNVNYLGVHIVIATKTKVNNLKVTELVLFLDCMVFGIFRLKERLFLIIIAEN